VYIYFCTVDELTSRLPAQFLRARRARFRLSHQDLYIYLCVCVRSVSRYPRLPGRTPPIQPPADRAPKVYFCILVTCPVSPPVLAARTLHFLLLNPIPTHTYIYIHVSTGGYGVYPALLPRPQSRIPFCRLTPSPLSTTPRSPAPYYCGRRINRVSITSSSQSLLYIYIIHYSTGPTRAASTSATIVVMLQEHFCRSAANGPDSVGEHRCGSRRLRHTSET